MTRGQWTTVAALVLGAGCAPKTETPEQAATRIQSESAAARQAIEASNQDFITHANMGHGDIVAAHYTEDATLALVGFPVAKGRQAIAALYTSLTSAKPQVMLTTESVTASGPLAVERGNYTVTLTPPGAPGPMTETGTYLVHWHQVGGKWLMAEDVATSDKPLPPPPSEPAAKTAGSKK